MSKDSSQTPESQSRRQFLKYSGTAIGGAIVGGVIGGAIAANRKNNTANPPTGQPETTPAAKDYSQALMYFTQDQFDTTEAAAERIFPKDDLGPGAKDLGVAYFIDHQLASQWGNNGKEYMLGPFITGEPTQGNYPSIKRHDLFTHGLRALQDSSQSKYQKAFQELTPEQQDELLGLFEKGEQVTVTGATAQQFFNLLKNFTLEGVYADPLYGGNKDMQGWKMRNFPGNQMSYTEIMAKDEFVKIDPASLHDHMMAH
ncbi:gluconate 2-dehydrogenase subunit 3 family protein [Paenibacillus sp. TAB 01]|uniref:gluconate 2-dehydrogenase subunit 3 family protein n=1 Tax=Paenibacillus sp. TAB 01 TaxID=3368988 RepID=UPI00375060A0